MNTILLRAKISMYKEKISEIDRNRINILSQLNYAEERDSDLPLGVDAQIK